MTNIQLHDKITELSQLRGNHLIDESTYTNAIIALVHGQELVAVEDFAETLKSKFKQNHEKLALKYMPKDQYGWSDDAMCFSDIDSSLAALRKNK